MEEQNNRDFLLRVENLSLQRDGRGILHGVNLAIHPGEIHGLLGLNGSGKSSLAYTLMGCSGYEPEKGQTMFSGQDIRGLSMTERARLGLTASKACRWEGTWPWEQRIETLVS